jgi:hypothetical protein
MPESPSNETTRYCPQCGAALRAGASFCTACGAAIAGAASASASRPQPSGSRNSASRSRPKAGRNNRLWLAIAAVVALVAVVAIGFALSNDSQQAPSASIAIPTVAALAQDVPYPDVARVSPENAHMSAMAGEAVIVDVRGQEFYDMGHARGAISLPLDQLPARFSELPKDKAVLFYCT